ncbi:hypothetical protein [Pseudooceanicola onchidii]|uniref:hypothetical protein n=1 Tax=Pseudooceanicola onchidii TaxID=2562279 RepID=UPI0010AA2CF1|nr:hypothetical protein [Pseudooceanicola onchidii]
MDSVVTLLIWLVALILFVWLCVLFPAELAEKRNRSQFLWVLVAILGTPMVAVGLLLYLGEKKAD